MDEPYFPAVSGFESALTLGANCETWSTVSHQLRERRIDSLRLSIISIRWQLSVVTEVTSSAGLR